MKSDSKMKEEQGGRARVIFKNWTGNTVIKLYVPQSNESYSSLVLI